MIGNLGLLCAVTKSIEDIWTTNLASSAGIVGAGGPIYVAAMTILSVFLLYGIYEAFMHNGGVRDVVLVMVKVAVCAFLIQNWTAFFQDISTNGSFVLANNIHNLTDYTTHYDQYVGNYFNEAFKQFSVIDLFKDGIALGEVIFYAIAEAIYWIGYYFLIGCFTIFGLVLFAVGPLVVALYPSSMFGSFAKSYLSGLLQWLIWPVVFAIVGLLMTQLFSTTFTRTAATGGSSLNQNALTNLALLALLGIALFFIPWISNHIISASFTGAASVVSSAAKSVAAAGMAVASGGVGAGLGLTGMMGGAGAAAGGGGGAAASAGGSSAGAGSGGGAGGGGGTGSGAGQSSGPPSPTPSTAQSGGGNIPASGGGSGSGSSSPSSGGSSSGGGSSAPPSGTSSGGKSSSGVGSRWSWSNAAAGAVVGYQQGFGGMAGMWARNHLSGNASAPFSPSRPSSGGSSGGSSGSSGGSTRGHRKNASAASPAATPSSTPASTNTGTTNGGSSNSGSNTPPTGTP